jgi:hypothetical protein
MYGEKARRLLEIDELADIDLASVRRTERRESSATSRIGGRKYF